MADTRISRVLLPSYLTNVSLTFQPTGLIADKVSPRIPVSFQSAKYRIFGRNNMVVRKANWAPGTIPNQIETRWSSDSYFAELYKLRTPLLDAELANNAPEQLGGIDLRSVYTQNVTLAIAIAREQRIATLFTTSANYPSGNVITKAGGSEWDTLAVSAPNTPINDLLTLAGTVADAALTSLSAISLVIPEIVWRTALQQNSALIDRIKYTQLGVNSLQLLANVIGVKEVIISQGQTAGPGPEIAGSDVVTGYTTTYLWGDTVWAGLIGEGSNDMQPMFSRSFNWTAATGGMDRQIRTYRMADEGQEGDWLECKEAMDEKIVYSAGGGVILNTLSTI